MQLLLQTTQELLDDPNVTCADSCATADHPMIDHIWRERLGLADRLVRWGPQRQLGVRVACTLARLNRAAIAGLKRGRDLLRRRT